jgi:hypothetical protein
VSKSYWRKAVEPVEQVKRWVAPLVSFTGGDDEPPVGRQTRFTVRDEDGNERTVYAPPGQIRRWP